MNSLAEDARRREVLGPGVDIVIETYDETNRRVVPARIIRELQRRGGRALDRHRRRAVEPVSARLRHRAEVPRRRGAGLHRRIPRLGLHRHAAGNARRAARGAGARHFAVCRRIRGAPARRGHARRVAGRDEAALQFHGRPSLARGRAGADPAAQACRAHLRHLFQHRPRPRLPLPVLVLHHHQRAGPQEPVPHARRSRADHPRQQGPGHRPVLHHRRQFRPQQRLGNPARPRHRAQGARGHSRRLHHPGRHAHATRSRTSSRRRAGPG